MQWHRMPLSDRRAGPATRPAPDVHRQYEPLRYGIHRVDRGGGGLGKIAITYGYNRYIYLVTLEAVVILVIMVEIFQTVGTKLAAACDKRSRR